VVTGGAEAEKAARYLAKGRLVGVTGHLSNDEWTAPGGDRGSRLYVTAVRVDYLDSPKPEAAPILDWGCQKRCWRQRIRRCFGHDF
jgi:single-stranded DNA-binding protein